MKVSLARIISGAFLVCVVGVLLFFVLRTVVPWWLQQGLQRVTQIAVSSPDDRYWVVMGFFQEPNSEQYWREIWIEDQDHQQLHYLGRSPSGDPSTGYWSRFGAFVTVANDPQQGSWMIIDPETGEVTYTDAAPPAGPQRLT